MTILIADDHALVRNGLRQVLEGHGTFRIIEAGDGQSALEMLRKEHPELAILDVEMPGLTGFEVAQQVYREALTTSIIFLTMFKEETVFNRAMDVGVKGYVLKENTVSDILQCVEAVSAGRYFLSPSISEFLIRRNARLISPASDMDGLDRLTSAERNILKLLATMKTNNEIADELKISVKTVHNHRNNICDKLGLHGAHALLKFAVKHAAKL